MKERRKNIWKEKLRYRFDPIWPIWPWTAVPSVRIGTDFWHEILFGTVRGTDFGTKFGTRIRTISRTKNPFRYGFWYQVRVRTKIRTSKCRTENPDGYSRSCLWPRIYMQLLQYSNSGSNKAVCRRDRKTSEWYTSIWKSRFNWNDAEAA